MSHHPSNTNARHASSRTWVNPRIKESKDRQNLNSSRRKICPRSPFWTHDFDLPAHKKEWEAGRSRRAEAKLASDLLIAETRQQIQGVRFPIAPPLRKAFDGKEFSDHLSPVLWKETVFTPKFEDGKENVAPWPSKAEMKYEGDDRISTDRIHGRFPGAPRVEGNETVNWQHRAIIEQYVMDDFYYPVPDYDEIFLRMWRIGEYEFDEEEGVAAIGQDLMERLDPEDQF